jgi:hypothetical protein
VSRVGVAVTEAWALRRWLEGFAVVAVQAPFATARVELAVQVSAMVWDAAGTGGIGGGWASGERVVGQVGFCAERGEKRIDELGALCRDKAVRMGAEG